jgi:DNA polymerase III sliding clamp (beta) subunit (PCNA family)
MLEALKFVQGAVAKKDFVPTLMHFHILNRRILGYNGNLAISSPIDLDIEACPSAVPFVKAIKTCRDTAALHITASGKLAIKSGAFRVYVDCTAEPFPYIEPQGEHISLEGVKLLPVLKKLLPMVALDASRPWASGILFRGQSAYATNNVVLIEHWLGYEFPVNINLPVLTIKELLRIKEEPIGLQVSDNSITFFFEGDRWLRSQVTTLEWPDISRILSVENNAVALPDGLFSAVADLANFTGELDQLFFQGETLSTVPHKDDGAQMEVPGLQGDGCFQATQLLLLEGVAEKVDFTAYPAPCIFYGENCRGAIVGVKQ